MVIASVIHARVGFGQISEKREREFYKEKVRITGHKYSM